MRIVARITTAVVVAMLIHPGVEAQSNAQLVDGSRCAFAGGFVGGAVGLIAGAVSRSDDWTTVPDLNAVGAAQTDRRHIGMSIRFVGIQHRTTYPHENNR